MICLKPFVRGMSAFGCGQCMPCRLNRRRLWTHRLMLEALVSPGASFITLTYDEENIPDGKTVVPRHLQLWLKRVRKYHPVRFYGVGEYGDSSGRPHYHVALFGVGPGEAEIISGRTWQYGFAHVGDLTAHSASYVCGYVTKKMTKKDDPRLAGRHPEFARMSLKPGIGAFTVPQIAEALQNKHGWLEIGKTGDVPSVLRHGKAKWPLGRYLTRKLREEMNFAEIGEQPEVALKRSAEMLVLYQDYLASAENALGLTDMIKKNSVVRSRQMEARSKIRKAKVL